MFPFTLQTPTCHLCLYFSLSNTDTCTDERFLSQWKTTTPLLWCKSGTDMRGNMSKLVFRRSEQDRLGGAETRSFKGRRQTTHTAYGGAVTSPLISQRGERVWIKVRRCQAFMQRKGNDPLYTAVTAKNYSLWYVDQSILLRSYRSLCIKC